MWANEYQNASSDCLWVYGLDYGMVLHILTWLMVVSMILDKGTDPTLCYLNGLRNIS